MLRHSKISTITLSVLLALVCLVLSTALVACSGEEEVEEVANPVEPVEVRVAVYRGPMSMGFAPFITRAQNDETYNSFEFALMPNWGEIMTSVEQGAVDVAVVPVGAALALNTTTGGGVSVVDICAQGDIWVVTGDKNVAALDDLHQRTVYTTPMGSAADTAVRYLLDKSLGEDGVTLESLDAPSKVVAELSADPHALGILEEPYASAAFLYDENLFGRVDITKSWGKHVKDGSKLVEGVVIVRNVFADAHPEAIQEFVEQQAQSTRELLDDPTVNCQQVYDLGFVDTLELAEAIVPRAHLKCTRGQKMHDVLSAYLAIIQANSEDYVDTAVPDESFYRYV